MDRGTAVRAKPENVGRWLKKRAYVTPDPGPDDHPTFARDEGLLFAKKVVSFFMPPNREMAWNIQAGDGGQGNPTKSRIINDVIKDVKKAQVRKLGKKSNAKRDLKRAEFRKTLRILESACLAASITPLP